jgi:hypothetical protein
LWIDYKDVDVLKDFINENVRIIPARDRRHEGRVETRENPADKVGQDEEGQADGVSANRYRSATRAIQP